MANGSVIFFGSAAVGVPFLNELARHFPIGLVITQPDAVGGRHCRMLATPIKCLALDRGWPLLQPESLSDPEIANRIRAITPLIGVVVAYGQWIPRLVHHLPRHRTVNVHFSLLPRFRGAAPVQRAIESGAEKTGLTVFEIARVMDGGDIWSQMEVSIAPDETSDHLLARMSEMGAPFLTRTLADIMSATLNKTPQDESLATSAPVLKKGEGMIDWRLPARRIYNQYRAFQPWPGTCFAVPGKVIQATRIHPLSEIHQESPGTLLNLAPTGLKIACGESTVLHIEEIKPPGKKAMRPYDYCLGNCFPPKLP